MTSDGGTVATEIRPGQVWSVPEQQVPLPVPAGPQPVRRERWLVVISNKGDCRDGTCDTVLVLVLSSQVQHQGRWDELITKGDGGTLTDCIAQTDLVMWFRKSELRAAVCRGQLLTDTMNRIKARLRNTLGL